MIAEVAVDHNVGVILSLSLVNEVLEYIHIDFKNIIYREGNPLFANHNDDNDEGSRRLPVSVILNSRLEDYFADVLLSDLFKKKLCDICAKEGQLESLKWAREHGCDWGSGTCSAAAEAGHLHILQWAREHGCAWDSYTCKAAAGAGHLHILQWAREHGCAWT